MLSSIVALVSGLLFGLGLIASGMTDPAKVQGFLDLAGQWDPSLAFVMAGGIAVGVAAFAIARRRDVAWSGEKILIPAKHLIDRRLIIGGLLFGAGWGIGGFCPGPAIVSLGAGFQPALVFVATMLAGMVIHDKWIAKRL
jgi:uncharacterized membrane protein YedE/YeeE